MLLATTKKTGLSKRKAKKKMHVFSILFWTICKFVTTAFKVLKVSLCQSVAGSLYQKHPLKECTSTYLFLQFPYIFQTYLLKVMHYFIKEPLNPFGQLYQQPWIASNQHKYFYASGQTVKCISSLISVFLGMWLLKIFIDPSSFVINIKYTLA